MAFAIGRELDTMEINDVKAMYRMRFCCVGVVTLADALQLALWTSEVVLVGATWINVVIDWGKWHLKLRRLVDIRIAAPTYLFSFECTLTVTFSRLGWEMTNWTLLNHYNTTSGRLYRPYTQHIIATMNPFAATNKWLQIYNIKSFSVLDRM